MSVHWIPNGRSSPGCGRRTAHFLLDLKNSGLIRHSDTFNFIESRTLRTWVRFWRTSQVHFVDRTVILTNASLNTADF
jgi:hypothetical protein